MNKILKQEDIVKISGFLVENGYAGYDIEVINYVADQETLNKLNEDYFYRSGEHTDEEFDNECGGVDIACDGIGFKFRLREENEDTQE